MPGIAWRFSKTDYVTLNNHININTITIDIIITISIAEDIEVHRNWIRCLFSKLYWIPAMRQVLH